jgi:hypothetical protein
MIQTFIYMRYHCRITTIRPKTTRNTEEPIGGTKTTTQPTTEPTTEPTTNRMEV